MTAPLRPAAAAHRSTGLHLTLWTIQLLLAAVFGMAGAMKVSQPLPMLIEQLRWPAAVPEPLVRIIGACELLGAVGLILPALSRIRPSLTPLAAAGLTAVMTLAVVFHATRGEWTALALPLVLGGLGGFAAWGRWMAVPIASR